MSIDLISNLSTIVAELWESKGYCGQLHTQFFEFLLTLTQYTHDFQSQFQNVTQPVFESFLRLCS